MPRRVKAYIGLVIASGITILLLAVGSWSSTNLRQFAVYLGLAALASTLKIRVPGMEVTMSPSFVFLLLGTASCHLSEVVVIASVASLTQSLWSSRKRPRLLQVAFSCAALILSSTTAFVLPRLLLSADKPESPIALIILAGSFFFPLNSSLVFAVISLTEAQPLQRVARQCYQRLFPYFMGGTVFAGLVSGAYKGSVAWKGALVLLPAVILAHFYFANRKHSDRTAAAFASTEEVCSTDIVY